MEHLNINNIIYIPGVYDLLHSGHFNLFYRAKILFTNSKIIVGVCSDRLTKHTKRQPIQNENIRVKNIQLLDLIDDVLIYDNLDQSQILKITNSNILIIPPDYGKYEEHKVTIDFANKHNISHITLPRTQNISTTEIINNEHKR